MVRLIECYDIGGTNIRGAVISDNSTPKILCIMHSKTVRDSKEDLVREITSMSTIFKEKYSNKIEAISIGLPGPVNNGILMKSPPMGIDEKIDLKEEINPSVPLYVDNDLNVAAMAELMLGTGKKEKNFHLLSISTGIGAGIVHNGKVLGGTCGEFGHDVIERNKSIANVCSCGNIGCWVAMASGYGIEKSYRKIAGKDCSTEEIYRLYKKDDPHAKAVIDMALDYNAHGIGNMLNAFPAGAIAVMGSVGLKMFKDIIPTSDMIKRFTVNDVPRIVPTPLGEHIGLLGAFVLANEGLSEG